MCVRACVCVGGGGCMHAITVSNPKYNQQLSLACPDKLLIVVCIRYYDVWVTWVKWMIAALLSNFCMVNYVLNPRPFHGVKKKWHNEVAGDLHVIGVGDEWFQLRQDCKCSAIDILAQREGQLLVLFTILPKLSVYICGIKIPKKR